MLEAEALVQGELARRAWAAADRLFAALRYVEGPPPVHGCSVGGGDSGIAVALAHWALRHGDEAEDAAARCIERAVAVARYLPTSWDLYAGWAGVGWAAQLLVAADECVLDGIDARVLAGIAAEPVPALPLVEGLAGVLVYACRRERGPRHGDLVAVTLELLLAALRPRGVGATWPTPVTHVPDWLAAEHPDGHDNLGVAHGAPGILAALAGLLQADVLDGSQRARVSAAIREVCAWIRGLPVPEHGRIPAWVTPANEAPGTRVGWCYGDVGAAVTLLGAARAVDDRDTEAFAIDMAHAAIPRVQRWDLDNLGICHGYSGVTHIYHRLWRATGEPRFAEVARDGCERILAILDDRSLPLTCDGLLEGRAGIALVLESACDAATPAWDAVLGCNTA